jgi:pyridine nucleotide-disulfide oxidoreductase family protein
MKKRVILLGGGHAHAGVLRAQALNRAMDAHVTLVTTHALAPYSGMLPGWMAGHYTWQQICLDFAALAARAGAHLVQSEAVALDLNRKTLHLASGEILPFDFLSMNIGSTHRPPIMGNGDAVLALRPLDSLVQRTQAFMEARRTSSGPLRVRVAGAGGAGYEMALAMQYKLQRAYPSRVIDVRIITDGDAPLPTHSAAVRRLATRVLQERGVQLIANTTVESIEGHHIKLKQGVGVAQQSSIEYADQVIWAGGAQPHLWPQQSGIALDARGFIKVNAALQSTSHTFVFATGDCAGFDPPLPKAGVYPVRQGPTLAANLAHALRGTPLSPYRPQLRALGLFATGPQHAIASYGPLALSGQWVWKWKNQIDMRFIRDHST